jgi:predicted CopG family antitoxin
MTHKISITVDDDTYYYLEKKSAKNRSRFINELLREKQKQELEKELMMRLREDAGDSDVQVDSQSWELSTGMDGLEDWEDDWDDSKAPRNLVG